MPALFRTLIPAASTASLFLWAAYSPPSHAQTKPRFDLASFLGGNGQPGAAVLVASKGRILYKAAAGLASVPRKIPMETNMVFNLASVSKQFTAMGILMLEADGTLRSSDSIRKHIGELPEYTQSITIRHLIHHQGGLPDYESICKTNDKPMSNDAVIQFLKNTKKPLFPAGSKYAYSNTGYVILASIVSRASGMPFHQFIEKRIFGPAGMTSAFILTPQSRARWESLPAKGHTKNNTHTPFSGCDTLVGDGSVIAGVEDLHKWFTALHKSTLLPAQHMKTFFTPQKAAGGPSYAYGLEKQKDEGEISYSHDGDWGGFLSSVVYIPKDEAWIILLTNKDGAKIDAISDALYERFFNQ